MATTQAPVPGKVQTIGTTPTLVDPLLEKAIAASDVARIAVQSEGVEITLRTFANIQVNAITGRSRWQRRDSVATVLSMIYRQSDWAEIPMIPIESPDLAAALGLDPKKRGHRVSPQWVMNHPTARPLVLGENSPGETSLSKGAQDGLKKLKYRVISFMSLPDEFRIVPIPNAEGVWAAPWNFEHPETVENAPLRTALQALNPTTQPFAAALHLDAALRQAMGTADTSQLGGAVATYLAVAEGTPGYMSRTRRSLDYFNTTVHPFQKSAWIYLAAFLLFAAYLRTTRPEAAPGREEPGAGDGGLRRIGKGASGEYVEPELATVQARTPGSRSLWAISYATFLAGTLVVVVALVIRYVLAQRMPVSNLYESITFALGGFAVLALVFEGIYRRGWVGVSAAVAGFVLMSMANSLPLRMRKVEPLVAVLNSVWLSWHVVSLMISYSCFLLSFVFCLLYLYKEARHNRPGLLPGKELFEYLNYRSIQVGWPLLTVGIFLGAVWANTAWGNYWSWDPKETWALITWFAYTIYLHLRMRVGWHGRRSIYAAMIGFAMVLITYFGVNYLSMLSGGLHSYAEPVGR